MAAVFCLRLAWGMVAALLLVSPAQVNPRFFRVHFLVAFGLTAAAALFLGGQPDLAVWTWVALGGGVLVSFLGSVAWSLDGSPGGLLAIVLDTLVLAAALLLTAGAILPGAAPTRLGAAELTSGLLLGIATTAMLMGHSYLIAPSMSIQPLLRLLIALFAAALLRGTVAGVSLWSWTAGHSLATLDYVTLLLPVRWLVGLVLPLVLGWMAWQAARIRSTQSATGILYALVFACFVGELTGLLLQGTTGLPL